jgi:hypothetical protein
MKHNPKDLKPVFSIHVSPELPTFEPKPEHKQSESTEMIELLRQLVNSQDRTNELLEELVDQVGAQQRQRAAELGQWKESNPILARRCRAAAECLGRVQAEFLENMTSEINENYESMIDGEFMFNEFVDRYGPRMAHLNGVIQMLSQLSSVPTHASSET